MTTKKSQNRKTNRNQSKQDRKYREKSCRHFPQVGSAAHLAHVKCKKMIKRFTIILIAFFIGISLPIFATAQIVTVEFSKIKDKVTGQMIYRLVYKRGEEVIAKRSYSNGKTILNEGKIPDGMVIENYPDGKVKNIMFFKNGKRNGLSISLYESGRIKGQTYYKYDKQTGKGFYYFESGSFKTEFENKDVKNLYYYEYTESEKRGKYRTQDGKDVVE